MSRHGHGGGPPQGNRRLQVITNSFKITGLPRKPYYQYDAFDDKKISDKSQSHRRIEIFERLQNHIQPSVFTPKVIYDSDAIAYSSTVLSFGNAATFEVNMSDRPPREGGQARGIFRVTLKRVDAAPITFEDLHNLVDGRTKQQTPRATVALNLVQLIVRQAPNLKYPNNVKAFFCREAGSRVLGGGLEVFRGYYQSVRPALRSLLVNIDTTCGVIYQEGPMIDVALDFLGSERHPRALNLQEGSPDLSKMRKFFKTILVTFTHRKGKKKIESIVPRAGAQKFEWNRDDIMQSTTVEAYFRQAYNVTLRFPDAVGVRLGGGSVVPIELCKIAPNQRFRRKLPQELTKKMVEFTSDKPHARLESIHRGIVGSGAALDYAASPFVKEAELQVSTSPTRIDGKILSTPPMEYRNKANPPVPRFGAWNAVNQQFNEPKSIGVWGVVDYSNPRDRSANERFVGMIIQNCQKLGMEIGSPRAYVSGSGIADRVIDDMNQAARQATGGSGLPDMMLVILPPSALEIRCQVKRYGDVLHGVVTQCVRVDKVARANDQYCNNVAMKINAKLGGVNAVPKSGVLMNLSQTPYIVMGADVGHPSPGVYDQPSVASLVASYDMQAMKYHAYTTVQPPRMETIDQLQYMVTQAITDFVVLHPKHPIPQKIIFFRDGLSEGEYVGVAEKEIGDIRAAIDRLWQKQDVRQRKPSLTFVVVGKRHHVRFFPQNERDADKSGNCPAGFVADQGIGNPIATDFYLQSHGGLLGTSRPSHYIVILDEIYNHEIESLQELAFALCHAYARATRSVSIPAPVYYADLVCSRANFHFAPELKYDDSSASISSGKITFNLDKWRNGFQAAHRNMLKKMFYM